MEMGAQPDPYTLAKSARNYPSQQKIFLQLVNEYSYYICIYLGRRGIIIALIV